MNNKVIIALDQGSSSSRVLAFSARGEVLARGSCPLETLRPQADMAEMDAWKLLTDQLNLLKEVLSNTNVGDVAALAVASQRSTIVFWDKQTGKPLAPVMSWQDGRAVKQADSVSLSQQTIHQLTGLYKTPFYSAAKITWALQHIPEVAQAAQAHRLCVGPTASYIIWHLTKGTVFACDATLAQRMLLFNIQTGEWDETLLQAFGIEREWLPQIKRTVDDYGVYEYAGTKLPIRVCVGDQQASLFALRVEEGGACINYGTGGFFMRHTGAKCHLLPGMLTSVAATAADHTQNAYILEGPVNACATLFAWLSQIGFSIPVEQLDTLYSTAKSPVWLLPALGGLGAPYWDFTASVVISGLSAHTSKEDVAAGAVRGLAFVMADIVFYAEQFGIKSEDIKVSGGLSQVHCLLQTQADILQKGLIPCVEKEGTAVGAALLAAQQVGIDTYAWETLRPLPKVSPTLEPQKATQLYAKWHHFVDWCKSQKS